MTFRRHLEARSIVLGLALLSGGGCLPNGEGEVAARFSRAECPPGVAESALEDYGWEAGYLATERFYEVLILSVQRYNVDVFETDSVGIRLDLEGLEQAGLLGRDGEFYRVLQPPLAVPVGPGRAEAQVLLSLFGTCERFPGYSAIEGQVILDVLRVRVDGSDTGDGETIVGRVDTSTLSYANAPAPIGVVNARFDYEPPRRPLREFE